ncbi:MULTISPECIES: type II toxin-antitoxin system Phd/YefM family antitoxin [unclassified Tolypothrix]|uniref:type II toxin-antitoxin system Phd/YefM family antitoxin n=1 Tax=unclassified Tolypothrix TaxID=2649714 RepID=UPI0005EAA340|nr:MULTISPECIES: prevent-host-death protein [unclassified Tolypothrix]BAY89907.1 prevent-host-death protein [Microchaete diplosiphon NIES-3275]EKE96920.1 toxin-antitoxin system, antitoxin component, PHD family [Tolypothrix sp. PCC 7601]MBE9082151.1 prevent-host-death protein [Tolypothrix sp. LEGE 11397]UYD24144.1 prevent-host-death protein [Tolypothrix sp. PCC 7712]UYD33625.1 prevent-host-death protein [Tolypothrix sp. PCC 7601]
MQSKIFDINQLQITVSELLSLMRDDQEIVITKGNTPVAKLTILNSPEKIIFVSEKLPQPGLNLGAMVMSDDFDQPLPDEFWLQNP